MQVVLVMQKAAPLLQGNRLYHEKNEPPFDKPLAISLFLFLWGKRRRKNRVILFLFLSQVSHVTSYLWKHPRNCVAGSEIGVVRCQ